MKAVFTFRISVARLIVKGAIWTNESLQKMFWNDFQRARNVLKSIGRLKTKLMFVKLGMNEF